MFTMRKRKPQPRKKKQAQAAHNLNLPAHVDIQEVCQGPTGSDSLRHSVLASRHPTASESFHRRLQHIIIARAYQAYAIYD